MNIQGVHRATDSFICNSFSPLVPLTDTVLFPLDQSDLSRSCTEQTAPSARPKCGRGSNPVLHSINKTQKQVLFPSIADQIPENIYTCQINQDRELLLDIGIASESRKFQIIPALLDSRCCTCSTRHGTLFPLPVLTFTLCRRANGCCHAVQARLCCKSCGHVVGLGPYLLSMTSLPFALVAVTGFSSFHFRFAPLISTPFAICRWLPLAQLLFCHWTITLA